MTSLHQPLHPQWTCVCCGVFWPCPIKQRQLQAEYDRAPVSLQLTMAAHFVRAARELRGVPAGELHDRFLGWLPGDRL